MAATLLISVFASTVHSPYVPTQQPNQGSAESENTAEYYGDYNSAKPLSEISFVRRIILPPVIHQGGASEERRKSGRR
jgi:hypothetical protein